MHAQVGSDAADEQFVQTLSSRWFGAGSSIAPDSAKAGAEATAAAIADREPTAVFVFCATSHDLPALLAAVREVAGPAAEIVGGTTLGELSSGGPTYGGVAVAALGGGFTIRTRVAHLGTDGHRRAGADVATAMQGLDQPHQVMMLLCDGLSGNPHEIVRGAYSVLGATVPLVGGFVGDSAGFEQTYQFHDDQVLTNAVVGIAIGSDGPMGIGMAHGWRRTEPPMVVTKSSGVRIYELDGKPALDVLMRRRGIEGDAADMFKGTATTTQSLGLSRRGGEDIRIIHAGDDTDGSVIGAQDVPQGALCWLMDGDYDSLIAGAGESCAEALTGLDGAPALGLFTFDCGGRRGWLGEDGVQVEVAGIRAAIGDDVPFAGFYTMGEIARVRGSYGTHALTLVTLALA
jgi:hypothetical protein